MIFGSTPKSALAPSTSTLSNIPLRAEQDLAFVSSTENKCLSLCRDVRPSRLHIDSYLHDKPCRFAIVCDNTGLGVSRT